MDYERNEFRYTEAKMFRHHQRKKMKRGRLIIFFSAAVTLAVSAFTALTDPKMLPLLLPAAASPVFFFGKKTGYIIFLVSVAAGIITAFINLISVTSATTPASLLIYAGTFLLLTLICLIVSFNSSVALYIAHDDSRD